MELDNHLRYIRNVMMVCEEEKLAVKQLIAYLSACKQMNLEKIKMEYDLLKNEIVNMLYVMMESGIFVPEYTNTWRNVVTQINKYFKVCLAIINKDDMFDPITFVP